MYGIEEDEEWRWPPCAIFVLVEALIVMGLARSLKVGRGGYVYALGATLAWSIFVALLSQLDGLSMAWSRAAALFVGAVVYGFALKTSLLKGLVFSIVALVSVMALAQFLIV
jgi:hypothetical protein